MEEMEPHFAAAVAKRAEDERLRPWVYVRRTR